MYKEKLNFKSEKSTNSLFFRPGTYFSICMQFRYSPVTCTSAFSLTVFWNITPYTLVDSHASEELAVSFFTV